MEKDESQWPMTTEMLEAYTRELLKYNIEKIENKET